MKYYKIRKQIADDYGIDTMSHNITVDGMVVVNEKEVTVLGIVPVEEITK